MGGSRERRRDKRGSVWIRLGVARDVVASCRQIETFQSVVRGSLCLAPALQLLAVLFDYGGNLRGSPPPAVFWCLGCRRATSRKHFTA
eukprot:6301726-Prymnesium_polylepis.1